MALFVDLADGRLGHEKVWLIEQRWCCLDLMVKIDCAIEQNRRDENGKQSHQGA